MRKATPSNPCLLTIVLRRGLPLAAMEEYFPTRLSPPCKREVMIDVTMSRGFRKLLD